MARVAETAVVRPVDITSFYHPSTTKPLEGNEKLKEEDSKFRPIMQPPTIGRNSMIVPRYRYSGAPAYYSASGNKPSTRPTSNSHVMLLIPERRLSEVEGKSSSALLKSITQSGVLETCTLLPNALTRRVTYKNEPQTYIGEL